MTDKGNKIPASTLKIVPTERGRVDEDAQADVMGELEHLERRLEELDRLLGKREAQDADTADLSGRQVSGLLRTTLETMTEGVLALDTDGELLLVNPHFIEMWRLSGHGKEETSGDWLTLFARPLLEDSESFIYRVQELLLNSHAVTREILRFTDGRIFESHSRPYPMEGRLLGRVWSFREVTDTLHTREAAKYQATHDPLTLLPNRRLLIDRLGQMLIRCRQHGKSGALLLLNLDRFKEINESLGHAAGDQLLRQVARRLEKVLQREDTAAYLGGDEFVLLFAETRAPQEHLSTRVEGRADSIRSTMAEPFVIRQQEIVITVSIGVTVFPVTEESAEDILKQADTAMHRAKEAGRDTLRFFLPAMQEAAERHLRVQGELRSALANDELRTYWQPQLERTGRIVGAEALLRWEHPEQGLIMPSRFIPIAEEAGLIARLGYVVLEHSCRLLRRMADEMPDFGPVSISVNVSPQQFQQEDFAPRVAGIIEKHGANPSQLTLELTENMLISDIDGIMARMGDLERLGVRFSIDDFGTGYSSMAYLKRLHLDELKIDRSFVRDFMKDPEAVSIVEAIATMATKLGLDIVAEGVENPDQVRFLSKLGCRLFQGNFLSEPLPEQTFWEYLVRQLSAHGENNGAQGAFDGF